MLCNCCEDVRYDDLAQEPDDNGYAGYPHHQNYTELQSCSTCNFCTLVATDIECNGRLKGSTDWQGQPIYLRVFPSTTAIDESNQSNLLVYSSPWQENGRDQTTLVIYGLFLERTQFELEEGQP